MKSQNKFLPLFSGAIIQLCIGIIYIWSIFQPSVMEYYSWSAADASLTFSIMLATFVLGIVLGGRLNDKKGPRPVVFLGGAMFVAGILLSSFVPQNMPWLIYVCYGGMAGFGVGAAYTSTISCAQKWFLDKKGFATGIIVCTFGASTVVFTPIVNTLLKAVGVSQTFLILALIFAVIILIFGWFVKNPSKEYMDAFNVSVPDLSTQKQFTPLEMVKTKYYYFIFLAMMLITPAYFIINPLLKSLGELRNLSEAAALAGVMVTGIASAAGRLLAPWMSDKIGRR
ncbi:MAG: MFS transporter, partial [Christensenella sp.]|uniref:MFS transporter n=1 Tax=Christensenella sp. TaxID=1935934 RepID=UPI002B1F6C81